MPWWALIYLFLLAALCCGGIYLDFRLSEPVWYTLADAVSAICSLTAIVAFWTPAVSSALGGALFITTGYALIWDSFSLEHDLKVAGADEDLSPAENRTVDLLSTIIGFTFVLPAYYFGFATAYDHIRAATPTA